MSGYSSVGSPGESRLRWALVIAIAILAAYLSRHWIGRLLRPSGLDPSAVPREVVARGSLADDERTATEIFEHVSDSVVSVRTSVRVLTWGIEPQTKQGSGSGFVWDSKGYIVTNYHVVREIEELGGVIIVRLKNKGEEQASVIGVDPDHDIAVLLINAPPSDLKPISLGQSHGLLVGQKVFAIGNPFGYDHTMTAGIISALDRSIDTEKDIRITGLIQTDAAISPGSSGGPLLDSAGLLIGMTTAISAQHLAANIGFALPVDLINEIVTEIIRHGRVLQPDLGTVWVPEKALRQAGYLKGVMVLGVYKGSTAEKAGLRGVQQVAGGLERLGDLIVGINGQEVANIKQLESTLSQHKVGDIITLSIIRNNETMDVEVTLQAKEERARPR